MLTMTDLFCGAGGSSTGAVAVPGVEVSMAANHWPLAIQTHNTNHPDTDHDCADISQVDPRRYPTTDILWASPECTNHSQAKGVSRDKRTGPDSDGNTLPLEAEERSRATMWDVVRFSERHGYKAVIVENVVEATKWRPFPAWLAAMHALDYEHQLVFLNSAHAQGGGAPAPQSRDRMYVVFHQKGNKRPDVAAWASPTGTCSCGHSGPLVQSWKRSDREPWGKYKAQYVYRCASCDRVTDPHILPASSIIDWTLPGQRIGDRAKPLADKTRARIAAGLEKFAGRPIGIPVEGRDGKQPFDMAGLMRTMTTRAENAVAFPPFMVELRGGGSKFRSIDEPMATVTASGNHHGLVFHEGMIMRNNGSTGDGGEMSTGLDDSLRTLTTIGSQSLVTWDAMLAYNRTARLRPLDEPLATMLTRDSTSLVRTAPTVDDCQFRMLTPDEVKRGMAFPADYQILGNKREQVRQAGNAVTPPAARDLISAVAESLGASVGVAA